MRKKQKQTTAKDQIQFLTIVNHHKFIVIVGSLWVRVDVWGHSVGGPASVSNTHVGFQFLLIAESVPTSFDGITQTLHLSSLLDQCHASIYRVNTDACKQLWPSSNSWGLWSVESIFFLYYTVQITINVKYFSLQSCTKMATFKWCAYNKEKWNFTTTFDCNFTKYGM